MKYRWEWGIISVNIANKMNFTLKTFFNFLATAKVRREIHISTACATFVYKMFKVEIIPGAVMILKLAG